jgi:hypothetical protein
VGAGWATGLGGSTDLTDCAGVGEAGTGFFSAEAGTVGGLIAVKGGSLSVAGAEVVPVSGGATREVGGRCVVGIVGSGGAAAAGTCTGEVGGFCDVKLEGAVEAAGAICEVGGLRETGTEGRGGVELEGIVAGAAERSGAGTKAVRIGDDFFAGTVAGGGVTDKVGGLAATGAPGREGGGIIRSVEGCAGGVAAGVTRVGMGRGGVARSVTARRWEAEAALSPVAGGARRTAGADPIVPLAGVAGETAAGRAGTAGAVLAEVGMGERPGSGGSGVILAVGISPGTGAREVAAGRGGMAGGAEAAPPVADEFGKAGDTGTDPVAGFAGRTVDPVRRGPVAVRTGALGGKAAVGVAAASGCCGARVRGMTTGPVRRGASGAGGGVSRSEAVGGRELRTGPAARGVTRPVAEGLAAGRSGGRAAGMIADFWRASGAGVNRREAVGGRNAPVAGLGAESGPVPDGGGWVRLSGMKTGADFRARIGRDVDGTAPVGGRATPKAG